MLAIALLIAASVDPCATAASFPRFVHPRFRDPPLIQRFTPADPEVTPFSTEDAAYLRDVVVPAVDAALASGRCVHELERALDGAVAEHEERGFVRGAQLALILGYSDQQMRLPAADATEEEWRTFRRARLLTRAKRDAEAADAYEKVLALDPRGDTAVESRRSLILALETSLPRRRAEPISAETPSVSELPAVFETSPLSAEETRYVAAVDGLVELVSLAPDEHATWTLPGWSACNAAWLFAIRGKQEARVRLERVLRESNDVDARARAARLLLDFVARTDPASLPELVRRVTAMPELSERSDRLRVRLDELHGEHGDPAR